MHYNNKTRRGIQRQYECFLRYGYSDHMAKKMSLVTVQLNRSNEDFLKLYLKLSVWFCDYYAILNYKRDENTISSQEKQDYEKMSHLQNFQEVLVLWKQDYSLLERTFEASLKFSRYSILGKISIIKNLDLYNHDYLNSICPNHMEDERMYGGWVEPNLYILSYRKQFRECKNDWENYKQDIAIPQIMGFLKNLAKHDYFNFGENANEMISNDYLWSCYWIEHIEADSERKKRILFVEKNEPETWAKEFLYNQSYMNSVLASYLDQQIGQLSPIQSIPEESAEIYLQEARPKGYAKIKEFLY